MKKKGTAKKRSKGFITLVIILFAVGFAVLCYPFLSNLWNEHTTSQAVAEYDASVEVLTDEDYSAYFAAADDYNRRLYEAGSEFTIPDPDIVEGYEETLNVNGDGMIGYVTIDCIGVKLPIYHTSDGSVPAAAAGHLKGTSLPVGGENTHAVINAHRGLPSAKLFTNLDKLEVGDIFEISVLDEDLYYEVDQIKTVLPDEIEDLYIEEGEDCCTLLTCTPYGVNTHRLLVRGTRTDPPAEEIENRDNGKMAEILFIAAIAGAVVLIIVFAGRRRRRKKRLECKDR